MRKVLVLALICAGCDGQSGNQAVVTGNISELTASTAPPTCTVALASNPPVPRTFGEIQSAVPRIICERVQANAQGSQELVMNGIPIAIGSSLSETQRLARENGATVTQTIAGPSYVFVREFPGRAGSFSSEPRKEIRRYWFNGKDGKLVGFRLCENYESGHYENQPNSGYASAFGPPNLIETFSESGFATGLRMRWSDGTILQVSGSPNAARLDVGTIPDSFKWTNSDYNVRLFRELVEREDRMDRDLARTRIAQENCLTSDELEEIIVPLLEAGVSSD